jgi:transposase InsO family protein
MRGIWDSYPDNSGLQLVALFLDVLHRQSTPFTWTNCWCSGSSYALTWQGWLYVAFKIDVCALRIVDWQVSTSMRADLLDALE